RVGAGEGYRAVFLPAGDRRAKVSRIRVVVGSLVSRGKAGNQWLVPGSDGICVAGEDVVGALLARVGNVLDEVAAPSPPRVVLDGSRHAIRGAGARDRQAGQRRGVRDTREAIGSAVEGGQIDEVDSRSDSQSELESGGSFGCMRAHPTRVGRPEVAVPAAGQPGSSTSRLVDAPGKMARRVDIEHNLIH